MKPQLILKACGKSHVDRLSIHLNSSLDKIDVWPLAFETRPRGEYQEKEARGSKRVEA
ncbi:MAG: hypothetical protein WBN10_02515 [Polyangiales bacterium]